MMIEIVNLKRKTTMKAASIVALICAVLVLSATVVTTKRETIGIYAIIDKVELEPDEKSPERIRIRGVFVVPVPQSSGHYQSPKRGFLYFSIAPGMEQVVKQEWDGLKALAGTGQGIGFAQHWVAHPTRGNPHHSLVVHVHRNRDEGKPEVYPLPHARGLVKRGDKDDPYFERIMAQLQRAVRDKTPLASRSRRMICT